MAVAGRCSSPPRTAKGFWRRWWRARGISTVPASMCGGCRPPSILQEILREPQEDLDVREVRGQPERDPHGAGPLVVDAVAEILVGHDVRRLAEAGDELVAAEPQGELPRSGVAEAARTQRDPPVVGDLLHEAVIDQLTPRVAEV